MFQNALSNLRTPVIQQFRELFGQYPLACFDNLIQRSSSQTASTAAMDDCDANPFLDWRYSEKIKELTPKTQQITILR